MNKAHENKDMSFSEDMNNFFLNEENKKIKKELEDKYGAITGKADGNLRPEIENEFLRNIKEFETAWETSEEIEIIKYLGNPVFRKIEEVLPDELPEEINKVLDIYAENQIFIDVLGEVENKDYYIFLTEELTEHKIENMRIEGMSINFIYEEFHPNKKLDAQRCIEDFLLGICRDRKKSEMYFFADNELSFNGSLKTQDEFVKEFIALFEKFDKSVELTFDFRKFVFGDINTVILNLIVMYKTVNDLEKVLGNYDFIFELMPNEFVGFLIRGCEVTKRS